MKIFISSVRRGLEEERDALPGLISAMGHESLRFEDYTARDVPSRQACLDGVENADAYLVLLGERYGDPLPDTGASPTEEEFAVARRQGIPVLAFRKTGVTPEEAQVDFIERIEDYAAGLFRGSFSTTHQLMTQVASAIRELERTPTTLEFEPLTASLEVPWTSSDRSGSDPSTTILEVHVVPVGASQITASTMTAMPARLARAGRDHSLFDEADAVDTTVDELSAVASTRPDRQVRTAGLRLAATSAVSVWQEVPRDHLGVIVDQSDIVSRIGAMVRLAADILSGEGSVALAVELRGITMATEGSTNDLGRRTSASFPVRPTPETMARVEPRDTVSVDALARAADEIAAELAERLLLRFRAVTR